jgi:aminoglycoside phosphotransferase (APT) family kinase protein
MNDVEEGIRRDLEAQLREPVRDVRPIPEGHSGFTYWVTLDGSRAVLRLPPPGARIAGPADIPRQARLMAALHAEGLPVPAVVATSDEPVVSGRPFVLVEEVVGDRIEKVLGDGADPVRLARSADDVLRRLQAVPLERTGIGGEPPMSPTGELERWTWLMERAPAELTAKAPQLRGRLAASIPAMHSAVMAHGDYHFGNMLFRDGRVVLVVDWEIAELGQPLLDLCCISLSGDVSPVTLYEISGADPAEFGWYMALTWYKYAAILGYNLMLHRRGKRPDPSYEQRTDTIVGFIDKGIDLLESGSMSGRG